MTVIDAHQHFWNLDLIPYAWPTAADGPIHRNFEEADLEPLLSETDVTHTVVVQAMDSSEDTAAMVTIADRWPRIAAIVGWLPLTEPDEVSTVLDGGPRDQRMVGVRHLIHQEPDPDWLLRPDVDDSLALLADHGLTFDVVAVLPRHLELIPRLADRHPALRMVVDHLAKPPVADGGWEPWASLLAAAGEAPNVYAKVSGLNTVADWATWSAEDLQPYVEHALDIFGPERLIFGSDWPVANLAGGYAKVWHETLRLLEPLAPESRERILGGTAVEFYGIAGLEGDDAR